MGSLLPVVLGGWDARANPRVASALSQTRARNSGVTAGEAREAAPRIPRIPAGRCFAATWSSCAPRLP